MRIEYDRATFRFHFDDFDPLSIAATALLSTAREMCGEITERKSVDCTPETEVLVSRFAVENGLQIRDRHKTQYCTVFQIDPTVEFGMIACKMFTRNTWPVSKAKDEAMAYAIQLKQGQPNERFIIHCKVEEVEPTNQEFEVKIDGTYRQLSGRDRVCHWNY